MRRGCAMNNIAKFIFAALVFVDGALVANGQPSLPVTGWYDGLPNGDGVSHGNGLNGSGPIYQPWLGQHFTHMLADPTSPPDEVCDNVGYAPQSVLDVSGNLYVFLGGMEKCCFGSPDGGPVQDPLAVFVRYPDGTYDLQQRAFYLPTEPRSEPEQPRRRHARIPMGNRAIHKRD